VLSALRFMDSDYPFGIFKLLLIKGLMENWWRLDFLETTNKIELKLYKHITGWSFSKLYFDMNLKSKIAITGQKHWTLFLCGLLQILNLVRCAWLIPTLRKYLLMLNVFFKCPGFWTEPGNTWPS
jgi:hypothetical protein